MRKIALAVAFILVLCGSSVQAQNDPLPDKSAFDACGMAESLDGWSVGVQKIPPVNIPTSVTVAIGAVTLRLQDLCGLPLDLDSQDFRTRNLWLNTADAIGQRLTVEIAKALSSPQTTASRKQLQKLAQLSADWQGQLGAVRRFVYSHVQVRTETKEVVKTVEVPCQAAPVVVQAPDPNAECDRVLRQAVSRWYGMATDILGPYGENGRANDAFQTVVQVRREMNGLSSDAAVLPVAVSWSQRLHRAANDPANVKRDGSQWDFFQLSESEQSRIEGWAEDIQSQLRLCRSY